MKRVIFALGVIAAAIGGAITAKRCVAKSPQKVWIWIDWSLRGDELSEAISKALHEIVE